MKRSERDRIRDIVKSEIARASRDETQAMLDRLDASAGERIEPWGVVVGRAIAEGDALRRASGTWERESAAPLSSAERHAKRLEAEARGAVQAEQDEREFNARAAKRVSEMWEPNPTKPEPGLVRRLFGARA